MNQFPWFRSRFFILGQAPSTTQTGLNGRRCKQRLREVLPEYLHLNFLFFITVIQ